MAPSSPVRRYSPQRAEKSCSTTESGPAWRAVVAPRSRFAGSSMRTSGALSRKVSKSVPSVADADSRSPPAACSRAAGSLGSEGSSACARERGTPSRVLSACSSSPASSPSPVVPAASLLRRACRLTCGPAEPERKTSWPRLRRVPGEPAPSREVRRSKRSRSGRGVSSRATSFRDSGPRTSFPPLSCTDCSRRASSMEALSGSPGRARTSVSRSRPSGNRLRSRMLPSNSSPPWPEDSRTGRICTSSRSPIRRAETSTGKGSGFPSKRVCRSRS